jgi:hypothetical protein
MIFSRRECWAIARSQGSKPIVAGFVPSFSQPVTQSYPAAGTKFPMARSVSNFPGSPAEAPTFHLRRAAFPFSPSDLR